MRKPSLRRSYVLTIEVGLIISLVAVIAAFNLDIHTSTPPVINHSPQPVIEIDPVPRVRFHEEPPPPARPSVPVVVDDNEIIDDEELVLDPIRYESIIDIGAPPPAPERDEPEEIVPFYGVQEKPAPVGGLAAIQQEIGYPDFARRAGVQGRVILQFVVDEDGTVSAVEVLRGIGAGCDEEAVRVLRNTRFTPGRQRGRAVKVKMTLPISFRLR